jgi:2-(1,2-epoxy-1,2-dihydrophenyl)acetyl-CoA isomerase
VDVVRYERHGPAARIALDRPEAKNALNLDAIQGLLRALERAAAEPDVRAVVLTGAGTDFSSGGDIRDMVARRGKAIETYERLRRGLTAIVRSIAQHERPVLARVDGVCLGAGLGLALACDALVATKRSSFGTPFVKVGLVPDTATSWLLPRMAGIQNARRLLLTGDAIDAEEAAGLGLITKLVPDAAALETEVDAWVQKWAALPPTAVRDAKRLFWTNLSHTVDSAIVQETMAQAFRFTTPEHAAAVDAFLARRGSKA